MGAQGAFGLLARVPPARGAAIELFADAVQVVLEVEQLLRRQLVVPALGAATHRVLRDVPVLFDLASANEGQEVLGVVESGPRQDGVDVHRHACVEEQVDGCRRLPPEARPRCDRGARAPHGRG